LTAVDHKLIDEKDIASLKAKILAAGLSVSQLVSTAWAPASTFRGSDTRERSERGAHSSTAPKGLRGQPAGQLKTVLQTLEGIQKAFNSAQSGGKKVSPHFGPKSADN
jgi:catalase-peroxidase